MALSFLISPVTFSEMIVDWSQISILNYIRGIIFLIGIAFVPGSCIYFILFPEDPLHQKFDVEPFFIKIIIYPVISFSFLGFITLILDAIGISRIHFPLLLLISILSLFLITIGISKHRDKPIKLLKPIHISISKYTAFILFLGFSVIIVAFGLHTHTLYLQENDGYRVIRDSAFIATDLGDLYKSYGIYWAYISFGLHSLTGIPIININAMLFPFLYLFVCALYLLFKSFLQSKHTIYALLATIFAITFSSLFYLFQDIPPHERISFFIFDGLFNFRYKSFSLILFLVSVSIFMISLKNHSNNQSNQSNNEKTILLVLLYSFFLFQSFIIYYIPAVCFIILFFCVFLISKHKLVFFRTMIVLFVSFLFYLLIFDLCYDFYFSLTVINLLRYFQGFFIDLILIILNLPYPFNQFLFYLSFISIILSISGVYWLYNKYYYKIKRIKPIFAFNKKKLYYLAMGVILLLLILELMLNIIRTLRSLSSFTFFLDLIFFNIGIIGIIALLSLKQVYKVNKEMMYILILWFLAIFSLALLGFMINVISYPNLTPLEWPEGMYHRWITYWFQRFWYYSIIPLSLFASVGVVYFIRDFKGIKLIKWRLRPNNRYITLIICSFLVFFSLSNTILSGVAFQNQRSNILNSEEAQITGWVSENVPPNSSLLVDRRQLDKYLGLISATRTALMSNEDILDSANYKNYNYRASKFLNESCNLEYYNDFNLDSAIIEMNDNNSTGQVLIELVINLGIDYGSFTFLLKTSNSSKNWGLNASQLTNLNAFSLLMNNSQLFGLNKSSYYYITDIETNEWYNITINFECTNSSYLGLAKHKWSLTLNSSEYGPFCFSGDYTHLDQVKFFTSILDANWSVSLSQFNFSRDPEFKLEFLLFKNACLFEYLVTLNYQYLILSSIPTTHRLELEQYIDVENELVCKLYKSQLYSYKTLTIYGA